MKARISSLVLKILNSDNLAAKETLTKSKLSENEIIYFEGKKYKLMNKIKIADY